MEMLRQLSVWCGAVVVVMSIGGDAAAEKFICESKRGLSPYRVQATPEHDHDRYAPKGRENFKRFGAYVSSFDGPDDDDGDGKPDLLAVPQWVSYELKGLSPEADGSFKEPEISIDRPDDWYKAPGLAFLWTDRDGIRKRRLDNSYDGIGKVWNRGHLAMADHAQRISWQASCNTHFFWNAVPQAADMNQGPWRHLEDYTAASANRFEQVWIIVGPVFEKGKPIGFIGEASKGEVPVAVPHSLFKIVVRELGDEKVAALAFLFTQRYEKGVDSQPEPTETWVNCNKARRQDHIYDHQFLLKSVADIEALTGLMFFPAAVNREQVRNEVPTALWPVTKKFWDSKGCAGQNYVP